VVVTFAGGKGHERGERVMNIENLLKKLKSIETLLNYHHHILLNLIEALDVDDECLGFAPSKDGYEWIERIPKLTMVPSSWNCG